MASYKKARRNAEVSVFIEKITKLRTRSLVPFFLGGYLRRTSFVEHRNTSKQQRIESNEIIKMGNSQSAIARASSLHEKEIKEVFRVIFFFENTTKIKNDKMMMGNIGQQSGIIFFFILSIKIC